jgi:hypothetical protein
MVVGAAFDGLAPAQALSITADRLQMIVQMHSEIWGGEELALEMWLCHKTNGIEKELCPEEKTF